MCHSTVAAWAMAAKPITKPATGRSLRTVLSLQTRFILAPPIQSFRRVPEQTGAHGLQSFTHHPHGIDNQAGDETQAHVRYKRQRVTRGPDRVGAATAG